MKTQTKVAMGIMFSTSAWFGLQAWFTQSAIHASSALAFNTERFIIAALVLGGICLVTRARFTKRAVRGGFIVGLFFAITIGLESQSLAYGEAGRVTFLGNLFIAFMPFLAYFVRSEKLYPAAILGSVIMLLGAQQLLAVQNDSSIGDIYAILRAAVCAIMLLLVGHYAGEDWRVSCFVNVTVVAIISLGAAVMTEQTQFSLQTDVLLPAIISALIGSVGSTVLMMWCGRHLSSTVLGVFIFLDSPFSVIWGVILYQNALVASSLLAYLVIGIGSFLALTAGMLSFNIRLVDRLVPARVNTLGSVKRDVASALEG